jgi:hypothetical protein
MYPLEVSSGLHEMDEIKTVRISPRDAGRGFSRVPAEEKVAGASLHHFGGFFKRSWRANDILWGRVDGVCQFVESLLESKYVAQLLNQDRERRRLRGRFFKPVQADGSEPFVDALDPQKLFPRAGAATHQALREWLRNLVSENPTARQNALDDFPTKVDLLIEAAQLEVLAAEVPQVIGSAIGEQAEWNRYQVVVAHEPAVQPPAADGHLPAPIADGMPWIFRSPTGELDPLVVAASAEIASSYLQVDSVQGEPATPAATRLGAFFRDAYRVGSERWDRDIPTLVLLKLLATTLLVARNCVLRVLGPRANDVRRNLIYKFGLDYPLRAFYAVIYVARQDPGWMLALFFIVGSLAVLALLVGIGWRNEIIFPNGELQLRWLFGFIIIPAAVVVGQLWFLLRYQTGFGWRRGLLLLLTAVASAVVLSLPNKEEMLGLSTSSVASLCILTVLPVIVLAAQGIFLLWLFLFWAVRPAQRRHLGTTVLGGGHETFGHGISRQFR